MCSSALCLCSLFAVLPVFLCASCVLRVPRPNRTIEIPPRTGGPNITPQMIPVVAVDIATPRSASSAA